MNFQLFVRVLCLSFFVMNCFVSFSHIEEKEKACFFAFIVLQMSCYCKCSVALPHGAMGWAAVCDCVCS